MSDETFVDLFDLFVNWPRRLSMEIPFLNDRLAEANVKTVVDAGAGPGRHGVALAKRGYRVAATDLSKCMVDRAREHAEQEQTEMDVYQCAFSDLPAHIPEQVDALVCLGNSLCMLADATAVEASLSAFSKVLKPGGTVVLHVLGYTALRRKNKRVSRPKPLDGGGLALKIFDLEPGAVRVNIVKMTEEGEKGWRSQHVWAPLLELSRSGLEQVLTALGFADFRTFGSAKGEPYSDESSYDLFLVARKT